MKIHEYQAKRLLAGLGVVVPRGTMVTTPQQAAQEAARLMKESGKDLVVLKAQIHAGGRGKGRFIGRDDLGGVVLAHSVDEVRELAGAMLGSVLVTKQTGPEGKTVRRLLVEEGLDIERELYAGLVVDRVSERPVLMASTEGGMEIEDVAANHPDKIVTEPGDPVRGFLPFRARNIASRLGLKGPVFRSAAALLQACGKAFFELDASLLEINPLVVTKDGRVVALDAKVNLDDNAAFRHPDWAELRDPDEEDPSEQEGRKWGLSYISMDGNIGCMVNGAGLAMATMDIIKLEGGNPANFLDVGGSAKAEQVAAAFKIIMADPKVRAIFINIFGGIMRCDILATGVVEGVREVGLKVPLVVRLEGTKVDEGKEILAASGLDIVTAANMADGARKAVELAG